MKSIFFSRNMEHVLHNISEELSDKEKEVLAFKTAIYYKKHPQEFLQFIKTEEFCVQGTYEETWAFIMESVHSLMRYCNLSVLFEQLEIYTNIEEK